MTSEIDKQNWLATLTVEIKQALALARHHGKITLSALMDAGDRLTEVKESFPHGEWDDWLRDKFDLSDRTARLYMQLAGHRQRVEAKMATVADLGVRGGCGRVSHFWFVLPNGMSREQAVETQELHGPFKTEAEALEDQELVLFGKDCKIEAGGMWDPAWDRV
jgi:Protein of unknown function (DUF3102)